MDQSDADKAVQTVYFEYLQDRYKNDRSECARRQRQFENGHPNPQDITGLKKAEQAYLENHSTGVGIDAARDALYGHFDHEAIWQKTVNQHRAYNDPEYFLRETSRVEEEVKAKRQLRVDSTPNMSMQGAVLDMSAREGQPAASLGSSKLNQDIDTEAERGPHQDVDQDTDRLQASDLNESLDRDEQPEKERSPESIEVSSSERIKSSRLNRVLDHEEQRAESGHNEKTHDIKQKLIDAKHEITSRTPPDRRPREREVSR